MHPGLPAYPRRAGRLVRIARAVMARLRRRPGRREVIALAAAGVLMALLGVDAAWRLRDARAEAVLAARDLQTTRAVLGPLLRFDPAGWPGPDQYQEIVRQLDSAQAHLDRAHRRVGYLRYVAWSVGWVPVAGPQVAGGATALELGREVTAQAGALLRTSEPLFAGEGRVAERAREVLVVRHEALDAELAALERASAEADRLRRVRWTGPLRRMEPLVTELSTSLAGIASVRQVSTAAAVGLDPLLGFDRPRTYLVMGQNEQEIRATGGYLGTLGVITVERGRLTTSDYRSSYDFDPARWPNRPPPGPLARYMGSDTWFLRDANWEADFPTSARRVVDFFKADQGVAVDGVVAVDTPMVQLLLGATGPLTVEGVAEPLTAQNFLTALEEELFESGKDSQVRKRQILQPVLRLLIQRVQEASASRVAPILSALHRGAAGRDLQLYGVDERVQTLSERLGASGRLAPREGRDFVAVVDSNISYNKIQVAIRREITYTSRADGRVDLLVRWINERSTFSGQRYSRLGQGGQLWNAQTATMAPAVGTFGNYVRIYFPPDTTFDLIDGFSAFPGITEEGDARVLGGLVVVRDRDSATLRLSYRPGGPNAPRATGVDLWKQGGQTRDTLRVYLADGQRQEVPFDGPFVKDLSFDYPASQPERPVR